MAAQGSRSGFSSAQSTMEDMRHRSAEGYEAVHSYVENNPLPSLAVALGLGFGVGIWLGNLLFPEPEPTLYERLGRQVLSTLGGVLPESVASRLHS